MALSIFFSQPRTIFLTETIRRRAQSANGRASNSRSNRSAAAYIRSPSGRGIRRPTTEWLGGVSLQGEHQSVLSHGKANARGLGTTNRLGQTVVTATTSSAFWAPSAASHLHKLQTSFECSNQARGPGDGHAGPAHHRRPGLCTPPRNVLWTLHPANFSRCEASRRDRLIFGCLQSSTRKGLVTCTALAIHAHAGGMTGSSAARRVRQILARGPASAWARHRIQEQLPTTDSQFPQQGREHFPELLRIAPRRSLPALGGPITSAPI